MGGFHEADWEFMQVEIDKKTLLPVDFSTSTHLKESQVRNPFDADVNHAGNHVVAYVADGGHGTYLTKGTTDFDSSSPGDGFGYGLGKDVRFDDKLLIPDSFTSGVVIKNNAGQLLDITAKTQQTYKLIDLSTDLFAKQWLSMDVMWGRDYDVLSPISNPPGSPQYNEDKRWNSPDSWLQSKTLVDSDLYQVDKNSDVQLTGLPSGQIEMGFLFAGTPLANLGHFDLVGSSFAVV